ncbi:DinB family protein [Paenibacillus campi]|uniref:DinB family protein n=1 Tax=Paenibacillus campi TaxID=3106031 RepID=UPI002AFF3605|nr:MULTISPECIES: DinB family protein [unclassified Paenibacillus]
MTVKEIFLDQFSANYDESGWFVSLKQALKGLSEDEASWKANESTNSIHGIMSHLIYYNQEYLAKFNGETPHPELNPAHNNDTFHALSSWEDTIKDLDAIMTRWKEDIQATSEEQLNDWAKELSNITQHMAYHIGQIVQIRKQQQSWNPEQGVS